jgi:uncharacterized membrane protein YqiK
MGDFMIAMGPAAIVGLVVLVLLVLVALVVLKNMINIVQQGEVGVVKRLDSSSSPPSSTACSGSTCVRSRCRAIARR